jgi:hypothetical protein
MSTRDRAEVTGYAVALPGDTAQDGGPVWFGGGKLAADLTLPKLRRRWEPARGTPGETFTTQERNALWELAAQTAAEASAQIRSYATTSPGPPPTPPGPQRTRCMPSLQPSAAGYSARLPTAMIVPPAPRARPDSRPHASRDVQAARARRRGTPPCQYPERQRGPVPMPPAVPARRARAAPPADSGSVSEHP